MMTRTLRAAALVALTSLSLGCYGTLEAKVQVYGGPVTLALTPSRMMQELGKAGAEVDGLARQLDVAVESTRSDLVQANKRLVELRSEVSAFSNTDEYKKVLWKDYADAWSSYATAVDKASGKAKTGKELVDLLKDEIAKVNKVTQGCKYPGLLPDFLDIELRNRIKNNGGSLTESGLFVLVDLVRCTAEGKCSAGVLTRADELAAGKAEAKMKVIVEALKDRADAKQIESKFVLVNADKAIESFLAELETLKGALLPSQSTLGKLRDEAIKATGEWLADSQNGQNGQNGEKATKAFSALAKLRGEFISVAERASEHDKKLMVLELDKEIIVAFLRDHDANVPGGKAITSLAPNIERLRSTLVNTGGTLTATARQLQRTAASFDLADPNLPRLVKEDNEKYWEDPLDKAHAFASGESEIVFVQEGPTRFNIKQLHANPKTAVDLAMSVAEVGLEIATKIIMQQTGAGTVGINLGASAGGSSLSADADAALRLAVAEDKRKVDATCRAGIKSFSSSLAVARDGMRDKKPTDKADPVTVKRVEGLIAGYQSLLSACAVSLKEKEPASQATTQK